MSHPPQPRVPPVSGRDNLLANLGAEHDDAHARVRVHTEAGGAVPTVKYNHHPWPPPRRGLLSPCPLSSAR